MCACRNGNQTRVLSQPENQASKINDYTERPRIYTEDATLSNWSSISDYNN